MAGVTYHAKAIAQEAAVQLAKRLGGAWTALAAPYDESWEPQARLVIDGAWVVIVKQASNGRWRALTGTFLAFDDTPEGAVAKLREEIKHYVTEMRSLANRWDGAARALESTR